MLRLKSLADDHFSSLLRMAKRVTMAAVAIAACVTGGIAAEPAELAAEQAELARKFDRLEALAKRIAELTEADDPARAEQLRSAIRKSDTLALPQRFREITRLIREEQLAAASRDQDVLASQLQTLLELLLEDPSEARDEAERKRLVEALKRIGRLILAQQVLRTDDQSDNEAAADRQAALEQEVERLREQLVPTDAADSQGDPSKTAGEGQNGDPSSGQPSEDNTAPPSPPQESSAQQSQTQRAEARLAEAQRRMQEAIDDLRESHRRDAQDEQIAAQRNLEEAKEEIEQALRQLREEEQQRRLTQLATRLRRMLAEQIDILRLTQQTDEDRPNRGRRATAIAAKGLANREDNLTAMANGALRLLSEDGESVAFPEVLGQIRDDVATIASRLRKSQLADITQRLEQAVIESLEEAIAALDQTLADLEERQRQGQAGEPGQQPGDPPLVDKLAELRMIRTIQSRIKRRTEFWNDLRIAGQADEAEAREALQQAAQRQARLIQALKNLDRPRTP